jgi:hypothetical protein
MHVTCNILDHVLSLFSNFRLSYFLCFCMQVNQGCLEMAANTNGSKDFFQSHEGIMNWPNT